MHVVVLAEDFYPTVSGGALTRWRFCELVAERGHRVTVFTPLEPDIPRRERVDGVEIIRPFPAKPASSDTHALVSKITRVLFALPLLLYVLWWAHDQSVDGIHSASHSLHPAGKALSLLLSVPLVTLVGYTPSQRSEWQLTPSLVRERLNFRLCLGSTVFCRSSKIKRIIGRYTAGRVEVLHGILDTEPICSVGKTVDPDQVREEWSIPSDATLLAMVGRLVEIKNPEGALEIVETLPEGYHLLLVGDGPKRESVESEIRRRSLDDRVTLTGELPHREALEAIAAADALVLPSHAESYGAVAFEALTFGTPVFARPVGALPELEHDDLHLGEVESLVSQLHEFESGGTDGIDPHFLRQYSLERYTDEILDAFERQL